MLDIFLPILLLLNFLYKLKFIKLSEEAEKHFSINEVTTFLVAYQAIRTLSEAVFESFPQTCFQTYMVLSCQDTDCGMDLSEEGKQSLQAIIQSLTISVFNIVMQVASVVLAAWNAEQPIMSYVWQIMNLGGGIPANEITKNELQILRIDHPLTVWQLDQLSDLMKKNKSVHTIDLRGCPLSDYGCKCFAEVFKCRMDNAGKQKKANSIKKWRCDWEKLEGKEGCALLIKNWYEYNNFVFQKIVDEDDDEEEDNNDEKEEDVNSLKQNPRKKLDDAIESKESASAEEYDIEISDDYWKDIWKKVHVYKDNEAKSDIKGTAHLIESNHNVVPNELIWTVHDRELKVDEIITLCKTLEKNTTVTLIKLDKNNHAQACSDEGFKAIATMLGQNKTIKTFSMYNIEIKDKQLQHFITLDNNNTLEELEFHWTRTRPIGQGFLDVFQTAHLTLPKELDYVSIHRLVSRSKSLEALENDNSSRSKEYKRYCCGLIVMHSTNKVDVVQVDKHNLKQKEMQLADLRYLTAGLTHSNHPTTKLVLPKACTSSDMLKLVSHMLRTNLKIKVDFAQIPFQEIQLSDGFSELLQTNQTVTLPSEIIYKKNLSEQEVQYLMNGLKGNTTIKKIDMSSTHPLTDKMCHYISHCFGLAQKQTQTPAIGAMKNMQQDWNANTICNRKIQIIADWNSIENIGGGFKALLASNQDISIPRKLNFKNNLTAEQIKYLSQGMEYNNCIETINLLNTDFTDIKAENLVSVFERNKNVKIICNWNEINEIGKGMQKLLHTNQKLSLPQEFVFNRSLKESEVKFLAEGIRDNDTTVVLDLSKTKVTYAMVMEVSKTIFSRDENTKKIRNEVANWDNKSEQKDEVEVKNWGSNEEMNVIPKSKLPPHPSLQTIKLNWESIDVQNIAYLLEADQDALTPLNRKLDLRETLMPRADAKALSNALKYSDRVDNLLLSWDNMSLFSIGVLLEAAREEKNNVCLPKELKLDNLLKKYPPDDVDVETFAKGLQYNCTKCPKELQIKKISINWNQLPLKGLGKILRVKHPAGPKAIDISGRKIPQDAAISLAEGIQANDTIIDFTLDFLRIEPPTEAAHGDGFKLFNQCKTHPSLQHYGDLGEDLEALGATAWEKIKQMCDLLDKSEDRFLWETRELAFISLLLKTNDSRLPTHVDLSNRKGKNGIDRLWRTDSDGKKESKKNLQVIMHSLKRNFSIQHLDLSSNGIDDEGLKIILEQLDQRDEFLLKKYQKASIAREKNQFKSINLANNQFITKTCAELMKDFLPYTYFKTIDFSHSGWNVGSEGILKAAAKKNDHLTLILRGKEALGSSTRR
jgi:hypothetical protein